MQLLESVWSYRIKVNNVVKIFSNSDKVFFKTKYFHADAAGQTLRSSKQTKHKLNIVFKGRTEHMKD